MDEFNCKCESLTKKGKQCFFKCYVIIPNTSGTGNNDLIYRKHRPVHLCIKHWNMWHKYKKLNVIKNGILQPFNEHKYGSIVLEKLVDWCKYKGEKLKMDKFWVGELNEHSQ